MITIKVSDYYGHPSTYRHMPESVFDKLEQAFLNDQATIDITEEEYAALKTEDC